MNGWRWQRLSAALLWLCAMSLAGADDTTPTRYPVLFERPDGVRLWFALERAATDLERQHGLMGRAALAAGTGMIFDFGRAQPVVMWMKDTPLALDMVFIDGSGVVREVKARTTPWSTTLLPALAPARYVVELAAGEAAAVALEPGSRLLLPISFPAYDPSAR